MPVLEFYRTFKVCSGIFVENGDPKGRYVADWSNMEVEIVKCGFWCKLPLLPLLWHANAVDEN